MRIRVDHLVDAQGRPKGHQNTKRLIGVVTDEFEIEENNDPMVEVIRMSLSDKIEKIYQNGDGRFYQPVQFEQVLNEGAHIEALRDFRKLPFGQDKVSRTRYEVRNNPESDFYPQRARDRFSHPNALTEKIMNLENCTVKEIAIFKRKDACRIIQNEIDQYIVHEGRLFMKVSEPHYLFYVTKNNNVGLNISMASNSKDLLTSLESYDNILAFTDISDKQRALETARELAETHGLDGVTDSNQTIGWTGREWKVDAFSPISSYAEELTVLYLAAHLRQNMCSNMDFGRNVVLDKLAEWTPETLDIIQSLHALLEQPDWFNHIEELSDVVDRASLKKRK